MIVIKKVGQPCSCHAKLAVIEATEDLYLGSIVECDCGQQYILSSQQMEGRYWAKYSPDIRTA